MMLWWLDDERVTRWFAIALAPVVFVCYSAGFHQVFGEFGGGDGSLPEVTGFFIALVMCGAAHRSITERTRLQEVSRERARYYEAHKAKKTEIRRAWAMGDSGPLLNWIGTEFDLNPMPIVHLPALADDAPPGMAG